MNLFYIISGTISLCLLLYLILALIKPELFK